MKRGKGAGAAQGRGYRETSFALLKRVIRHGAFSNVVVTNALRGGGIPTDEKRKITALTYGVLRNFALLEHVLKECAGGRLKTSADAKLIGLMAAYEIFFMDAVPAYAAINEHVALAGRFATRPEAGFLNACLRAAAGSNLRDFTAGIADPVEKLALETSHPPWLTRRLASRFGAETCRAVLTAANSPLPLYVRATRLKTGGSELARRLRARGWSARHTGSPPQCVEIGGGGGFPLEEYDAGLFTPQDRAM
ncbi:MAG: transcription antitermination factor NusB, partial [bacterium]